MEKSARENITLRMHPNLQETLRIQAIREKRSFSDLVEAALLKYLQSTEKPA